MADDIRELQKDHANFARLLNLLEAQISAFHQGETPDYDLMLDIMHYMIHYPDRFHHPREDLAFKKLIAREDSIRSAVAEVDRQHEALAKDGAQLLESLRAVMIGEVFMSREALEAPAKQYIEHFRKHMDIEEQQILPLAAKVLSNKDWAAINRVMKSRKDPLFGEAVAEDYQALAVRINAQGK